MRVWHFCIHLADVLVCVITIVVTNPHFTFFRESNAHHSLNKAHAERMEVNEGVILLQSGH